MLLMIFNCTLRGTGVADLEGGWYQDVVELDGGGLLGARRLHEVRATR